MNKNETYQYRFSIIVSVYNVEEYIQEALDSLTAQTIGFEEHVQVILVNDGSTDNSATICKNFQNTYPSNVSYLEKENGGLSSARNLGLRYIQGKYVNFFDPDDVLPKNVLSEVYQFFETHYSEINYATIPLVYFEGQKGLHGKYKWFGKENRIISLQEEPHNFILTAAATFYKVSAIQGMHFDERLITGEDGCFNMKLNQNNPCFGYICEDGVKYLYRKRLTSTSNVDKIRTGKDTRAWTTIVRAFEELFNKSHLEDYEQEYLVYELRSRLRDLKIVYFQSANEYYNLLQQYKYWINKLDVDFILARSKWLDRKEKRALFLQLQGKSYADYMNNGSINLSKFDVRLKNFTISSKGYVEFDCIIYTFENDSFDVVLLDSDDNIIEPIDAKNIHSGFDLTIGEFTLDKTHYRRFSFPAKSGKLRFMFRNALDQKLYRVRRIVPDGRSPFVLRNKHITVVQNGFSIRYNQRIFVIKECQKKSFVRKLRELRTLHKTYHRWFFERLLSHENKKYILINDRPEKGGDNGQALFEHIMANGTRSLQQVTYFVLDKGCPDYKKLKSHYHVISSGSLRHKYLFLNAKYVYSSHNARNIYQPFKNGTDRFYLDLLNYRFVWLQHGITKDDISKQANRLNSHNDYVVVSTKSEQTEFSREPYFLSEQRVLLTGMARYDKLINSTKRIITIAPTWRQSLSGRVLDTGYHQALSGFQDSEFFKTYASLLASVKLKKLLEDYDFICQFVLHPGISCYENDFFSFASDRMKIIPQEEAVYTDIFAESAVFITDYSSTAFDFAYLRKPLIYYQFDEEAFFSTHYERGYFDYRKDGFGPVATTENEILDYLEKVLQNKCVMKEEYRQRVNNFFAFDDQSACQRILKATLGAKYEQRD